MDVGGRGLLWAAPSLGKVVLDYVRKLVRQELG